MMTIVFQAEKEMECCYAVIQLKLVGGKQESLK